MFVGHFVASSIDYFWGPLEKRKLTANKMTMQDMSNDDLAIRIDELLAQAHEVIQPDVNPTRSERMAFTLLDDESTWMSGAVFNEPVEEHELDEDDASVEEISWTSKDVIAMCSRPEIPDSQYYSNCSIRELKTLASKAKVKRYSNMTKSQLVEALS
ncbi:MAG: Rho termination factor N-terminal domain-containing protein [Microcystaceae cyanobacterium]